jgi:hypothetical protein
VSRRQLESETDYRTGPQGGQNAQNELWQSSDPIYLLKHILFFHSLVCHDTLSLTQKMLHIGVTQTAIAYMSDMMINKFSLKEYFFSI